MFAPDTHLDRLPRALAKLEGDGSTESSDWWRERCAELLDNARALPPRRLLRWPALCKTMHMKHGVEHDSYYQFLLEHDFWHERWSRGILETPVGGYIPYKLNVSTSPQLIQHAFHLAYFMTCTGVDPLDVDTVLEIGGGYGSLCRLFHNLGHRGRYVIHDLPLFTEIQNAWLRDVGIPTATSFEEDAYAQLSSDAELFPELLQERSANGKTLLVSTWGVSEIPLDKREALLSEVGRAHAILFSFQQWFSGVDNLAEFNKFMNRHGDVFTWRGGAIPAKEGSFYLFGTRR